MTDQNAQLTIKFYSSKGFDILYTLSDKDDGALLNRMAKVLERLDKNGCTPTPPRHAAPNAPATQPTTANAPENAQAPLCHYHGSMRLSTKKGKEGTFYCPAKLSDDTYCQEVYPPKAQPNGTPPAPAAITPNGPPPVPNYNS